MAFGLVCLAVTVFLASRSLGFGNDTWKATHRGRTAVAESVAMHCTYLVTDGNTDRIADDLGILVARNEDILSAGVRRDGKIIAQAGDHSEAWKDEVTQNGELQMFVPVFEGNNDWGQVELRFAPLTPGGWRGWLHHPVVKQLMFLTAVCLALFAIYLNKMLSHLDPSKVIPTRVRTALDTLAEGLLVIDKKKRIVLANRSFAKSTGISADRLQGGFVSDLPFSVREDQVSGTFPWVKTLQTSKAVTGSFLDYDVDGEHVTYMVNSSPIIAEDGSSQGVLVSFDDVTEQQQRTVELRKTLEVLEISRERIRRQNEELTLLATRDPMTGCLNRRSFFEQFERHWDSAKRFQQPISCVMVDVDHFKRINDSFGHLFGDEVLKKVSSALQESVRESDLLCRYGGEEFCVLMPQIDIAEAQEIAERLRHEIASIELADTSITASLGVSSIELGAEDPQDLLDQADKCLYVAKRGGRNCVVRFDQITEDEQLTTSEPIKRDGEESRVAIPFHAVTALVSALGFRDSSTAEHSRRVADLCVGISTGLLSSREIYVLEIAGLLHDIGKIGIPDAILLKPGPLTEREWKSMGLHDQIGVEIIESTFDCAALTEIVRAHHAYYGGTADRPELPQGDAIPVGARILAIADAYDAMTSDRVYRKGRSSEEAVAELRRCAGEQFDPVLVESLVEYLEIRDRVESIDSPDLSKQDALRIGLQIERLTSAIDNHDIDGLRKLAGTLKATAVEIQMPQLAEVAAELETLSQGDPEFDSILDITATLLDICRSTQKAYLDGTNARDIGVSRIADSEITYSELPTISLNSE